jgi:hypothetical protein
MVLRSGSFESGVRRSEMKKYAYDTAEMILAPPTCTFWSSAFLTLRGLQPATAARQICAMGAASTSGQ